MSVDTLFLDEFFNAYVTAALWSTSGDDCEHLDEHFTIEDIDPDSLADMRIECDKFATDNYNDITLWGEDCERQAGHDFWFTRNGHGVGFWESEWTGLPSDPGTRLDAASESFGACSICVGDDSQLHFYNG